MLSTPYRLTVSVAPESETISTVSPFCISSSAVAIQISLPTFTKPCMPLGILIVTSAVFPISLSVFVPIPSNLFPYTRDLRRMIDAAENSAKPISWAGTDVIAVAKSPVMNAPMAKNMRYIPGCTISRMNPVNAMMNHASGVMPYAPSFFPYGVFIAWNVVIHRFELQVVRLPSGKSSRRSCIILISLRFVSEYH